MLHPTKPIFYESLEQHLTDYFQLMAEYEQQPANVHDLILRAIEPILIKHALKFSRGNQMIAAEILGWHRNTLRKKIIFYQKDLLDFLSQNNTNL